MIQNYLQILEESLNKKIEVLDKISQQNAMQESLLQAENFSFEQFDATVDIKAGLIEDLIKLDEGFENLYHNIKDELTGKRDQYASTIKKLQELIALVTEKSVSIQVQETRNKNLVETVLVREKRNIRKNKNNAKVAYDYYKNMNNGNVATPQFMDQKK